MLKKEKRSRNFRIDEDKPLVVVSQSTLLKKQHLPMCFTEGWSNTRTNFWKGTWDWETVA